MASLCVASVRHYWRVNLAVVCGVGTAVAVLAGALIVGDSIRESLRVLFLARLGNVHHALSVPRFFRAELAAAFVAAEGSPGFAQAVPLIALAGSATHEGTRRRRANVAIYGVDERFWKLQHWGDGPHMREAWISASLARELAAEVGTTLLLRVPDAPDVPGSSLFGRRDASGRSLRVQVARTLGEQGAGGFSLRPTQAEPLLAYVPLALVQRSLDKKDSVNTLLFGAAAGADPGAVAASAWRRGGTLSDLGLGLRTVPSGAIALESRSAGLTPEIVTAAFAAAQDVRLQPEPVLTHLANSIRAGRRSVPYSVVTALPVESLRRLAGGALEIDEADALLLNEWAARELSAGVGDRITLEYFVWKEEGRIETRSAAFGVAAILPLSGAALDPDLAPDYPGISDSLRLSDWDPPFPIDLGSIRPQDEAYWERHRTTPKAYVALRRGQELWGHRLGALSSIRFRTRGAPAAAGAPELERALLSRLDPWTNGFAFEAVRERGLAAARGSTEFGAYFLYFSAFLVFAGLLLAGLFFRFGVEQRSIEVGLLRAIGFTPRRIRSGFLLEAAMLSVLGGVLGALVARGYAGSVLHGLRTIWLGATGTTQLVLYVRPLALATGVVAGIGMALVATAWTLRDLARLSPRRLLAGERADSVGVNEASSGARFLGFTGLAAAGLIAIATERGAIAATPGFFGAGLLVLASSLQLAWWWLRARRGSALERQGRGTLLRLGARWATQRPGRALLCAALIAAAVFLIVGTGAFHRVDRNSEDPHSPGGGFALFAEATTPLFHDLNTPAGREALNLADSGAALEAVRFVAFRRRAGDDASCLNLYRPDDPTLLGVPPAFVAEGRFRFAASRAAADGRAPANPWQLLEQDLPDGSVPVIADRNSLDYVLHKQVGDEIVVGGSGSGAKRRLTIVAALEGGFFQSELLMAERRFVEVFPDAHGYRAFLIQAPPGRASALATLLEDRLADAGIDVTSVAERLAGYHRVENTYLATFQALGALGLVVGTLGLAAILMRNLLERRREWGLLRAVGFERRHLLWMALGENALLLLGGLGIGLLAALVAVAPLAAQQAGRVPFGTLAAALAGVVLTGIVVSVWGALLAGRAGLLRALRSE